MSRQMYWNEEAHQFFPVDDVPQEPVKPTNADRIRSMTDEELAKIIGDNIDCSICKKMTSTDGLCHASIINGELDCYGVWLNWLKKEVEE